MSTIQFTNTVYIYDEDSNATEITVDLTGHDVETDIDTLIAAVNAAAGTTYKATSAVDGEGYEGEYIFGCDIA